MYFVSESSGVKKFLDLENLYFKPGGETTVSYIENQEDVDYSSLES
jgi:hypothetical protein